MVKTLPERVRACTTPSLHRKHKKAPPATTRDKKSDCSIAKREREREREKQKKERSPAAGDDPHWPTLWRWMFCGSHAQIHASKFNTRRRPLLFRERPESCECQRFAFVFFVRRTSTTRPPLMVCPPRRGGEQRGDGLRLYVVLFSSQEKKRKNFWFCLKP